MGIRVRDLLMQELGQLRYEPIDKRIRGILAGHAVVDSDRAVLVWEPKRIVPSYGVPFEDIAGGLIASADADSSAEPSQDPATGAEVPRLGDRPVYDPSVPFFVHTAEGQSLDIRLDGTERRAAAFRLFDEALSGHVVLDFAAFDAWYEEDEPNVGHPRDPFHRIEIVHSSRHLRVERDGELLAESTNPCLLFESMLPVRYYVDPEDVVSGVLRPSATKTLCAYKGQAAYWSIDGEADLAWSYPDPLREAAEIKDHIAFFNERVDLVIDGNRHDRPVTPWSRH
jgi:uncharacterized protein (DUF427 family)